MKVVAKLFAIAAITLSCAANAADSAPHKEAVLDTGKGGLHLVVSVPDFADGPYDFAHNKGPKIGTINRSYTYGEVMFNAGVEETGVVVYLAAIYRDPLAGKNGVQPITAESIAQGMIKKHGFEGRGVKINSPSAPIEGAEIVSYKMSGYPKFDGVDEAATKKESITLTAISFDNNTQGYTLVAKMVEKVVNKFDADPGKYEKRSNNALGYLFRNSTVTNN